MKRLWMGVMMVGLVPALLAAGPGPAPCDSCAPCAGGCGCSASCGKSFKEKFLRWLGYRPRYCGTCRWHCDRATPPLYTFFPPCAEWPQPPHFSCPGPCCRRDAHVGVHLGRARCGGGCRTEGQAVCQQAKGADEKKPAAVIAKPPTTVAAAPRPQATRVVKPAPQVTRVLKPVVRPEVRPVVVAEPEPAAGWFPQVRKCLGPASRPGARWFPRIRRWFGADAEPSAPGGPYARPYDRPWLGRLRGNDALDSAMEASQLHPESYWGSVYRTGHRMFALPTGHGVPGASDY